MKKYIIILFCYLVVGACTTDEEESTRQIFRYNQLTGITSLDPAFAKNQANIWPVNQLFNGLLQFDNDLNIQPAIAERWNISDDGLTYTFYLRSDVLFHNDDCFSDEEQRKVTAHDFVYSFNRITDPALASPGAWIFSNRVVPDSPFVAVNDSVFQIRMIQPFRPLLDILTMHYTSVVPEEAIEYYGDEFSRHPVGTGPFMFSTWEEGVAMNFIKNPDYFENEGGEQLPYLDAVKISFMESPSTQFLEFKSGHLEFMSGIEGYKDDVLTKEGRLNPELEEKIIMDKSPYLNTEYIGFLMDKEKMKGHPIANEKVRKAFSYAIDRDKMIRYLRNSLGIPAHTGFVPAGLASFDPTAVKGYEYNPEKARQLMAEAGYPEGEGFPKIRLTAKSDDADVATFVQNAISQLGIKVKLDMIPGSFLIEQMSKSQVMLFRGSWLADYPDAENYLTVFYGENPAPPNYTRFKNEKYDSLYRLALAEKDKEKRFEYYHMMDNIIMNHAPVICLYYDEAVRFKQKYVKGLEPNPMNLLILKKVKLER